MENEVSREYAKALFELSTSLEEKENDLQNLGVLSVVLLDEEVMKVFKHPTITIDAKKELVATVIQDKVSKTFLSFIEVLIDNKRLGELANIYESYQNLLDNELGQMRVKIKTRYALSIDTKQEITHYLANYYHKKIILSEIIDESLSNGVLITTGNEQLDLTLATKLNQIINKIKG